MNLSGILVSCIFVFYSSTGSPQTKDYCPSFDKNVCLLPKEVGPCRGSFTRFHFDKKIGSCRRFIYGGCAGNGNNFLDSRDCQKKCPTTSPICLLPKVQGPCKGYFPRYYFNACTGKCERFIYGGCHGNKNNFPSKIHCYKACPCDQLNTIPTVHLNPICYLPKESGPCKAHIYRYFYNKCTRKCQRFVYGGCCGNGNNFKSYKECDSVCHYPKVKG